MRWALLVCAVCILASTCVPARADDVPATLAAGDLPATLAALRGGFPLADGIAGATGDLYLEVAINGMSTQKIAQFFITDTTISELRDLGLRTDDLHPDAQSRVGLGFVPGLRYTYQPERQRINLETNDSRRLPAALANAPARPPTAATGTGLVINYDATVQTNSPTQYGLYSEERFFYPGGVFDNTGTAYWYSDRHRYVRLDTSWSHSDTDTLVTTRLGDTISSSLTWTRPVRMGGAQVSRDFSLRPDLITYPVPALAGSAAVPSAIDLYVNNVRQFSGNAPSGPFVINAVPAINGAGEAVIVSRDTLGRSVMTTVPLYIDARLLARGLTDFSVEAGFVRRAYSQDSFDYAGEPSLSASLRRGITGEFTLEAHSEITRGVYNAGVGMLFGIGQWGVFNMAVAGSAGNGGANPAPLYVYPAGYYDGFSSIAPQATAIPRQPSTGGGGVQVAAGWQWRTPAISVDLQATKATPHYSDLAAAEGTPVPRATYRATLAARAARARFVEHGECELCRPG